VNIHIYEKSPGHPEDSPGTRYPIMPICRSLRSLVYSLEKANPPSA
jgi:hypothetical protein